MTEIRRYLCPLDCDWQYDEPAMRDHYEFADPAESRPVDSVLGFLTRRLAESERVVRAHFDTHPLEQWVMALLAAQQERDRIASELDAERRQAQHVRDWMQTVSGLAKPVSGEPTS